MDLTIFDPKEIYYVCDGGFENRFGALNWLITKILIILFERPLATDCTSVVHYG